MVKQVTYFLLIMGMTLSAHGGIKSTVILTNPLETHLKLEWDPAAVFNIATLAPLFTAPQALKEHVIELTCSQTFSLADEENFKAIFNLFNTKKVPKKVIIDAKARTLPSSTTDILQNLKAHEIFIKYVMDTPLHEVQVWAKRWMINSKNVHLELTEYKGIIDIQDLLQSHSAWLTTHMSDAGATKITIEDQVNTTLTVHPNDVVRAIFSPEGLKNRQEWSSFLETYATKNPEQPDYSKSFAMPEYKVPMKSIEDLKFFMQWYKNRDFSVYLDNKTMYDAQNNQLIINTAYLNDIASSDTLRSLLSLALNETSRKNTSNNQLYIENWEHCLKLPHVICKKTGKKEMPTQNVSIEKIESASSYALFLWLSQTDVIKKNEKLSEADKDELINELGQWSHSKLKELGVDIPTLKQRQKEVGRTVLKESKRRFFERKSNSSQED